jgi:micrococcal nuclease
MTRVLLVLLALYGGGPAPVEPSVLESPNRDIRQYRARFVSCYDGDTCDFIVRLGLGIMSHETVRFYGIDTPELRGSERKAGIDVRDYVVGILSRSHQIVLQVPQRRTCRWEDDDCDERGRYGRLLANVIADGQSISALLLRTRRAKVY